MIMFNDYVLIQHVNQNMITISLPQTQKTINNTAQAIHDRQLELSTEEEAAVLRIVVNLFERKGLGDESLNQQASGD